jgi:hypothetical protein
LWKKINDFVASTLKNIKSKQFEEFINESYADIFKAVGIIGGVIILLVIAVTFMVAINSKPYVKKVPATDQVKEEKIKPDTSILLIDEFVYPPIDTFEITAEYENFMQMKKYKIPDFNSVKYDIMMTDSIDESCKFDFERRR